MGFTKKQKNEIKNSFIKMIISISTTFILCYSFYSLVKYICLD